MGLYLEFIIQTCILFHFILSISYGIFSEKYSLSLRHGTVFLKASFVWLWFSVVDSVSQRNFFNDRLRFMENLLPYTKNWIKKIKWVIEWIMLCYQCHYFTPWIYGCGQRFWMAEELHHWIGAPASTCQVTSYTEEDFTKSQMLKRSKCLRLWITALITEVENHIYFY